MTRSIRLGLFLCLLLTPSLLWGDGGTLRVANVPMGAYRINVFTDPTPIPPDSIDVSVLATYERGRGVAMGLEILVTAVMLDGPGGPVEQTATRDQADDPRYYAAKFALGRVGRWAITVRVAGPEGEGEVSFEVGVQEPGLMDNPYLILVLALFPLLLVGFWLRKSKEPPGQNSALAAPSA
jgi:hypothetical protein